MQEMFLALFFILNFTKNMVVSNINFGYQMLTDLLDICRKMSEWKDSNHSFFSFYLIQNLSGIWKLKNAINFNKYSARNGYKIWTEQNWEKMRYISLRIDLSSLFVEFTLSMFFQDLTQEILHHAVRVLFWCLVYSSSEVWDKLTNKSREEELSQRN